MKIPRRFRYALARCALCKRRIWFSPFVLCAASLNTWRQVPIHAHDCTFTMERGVA